MTEQPDHKVANPHRTQIDDDELSQVRRTEDAPPEPGQPRDPHDKPWQQVAEEVKKAVENADRALT
jgi:hypothetical protein